LQLKNHTYNYYYSLLWFYLVDDCLVAPDLSVLFFVFVFFATRQISEFMYREAKSRNKKYIEQGELSLQYRPIV